MATVRYAFLSVALLAACAGCTSTAVPQLPAFNPARYGMGGCPAKYLEQCRTIAGRTFLSYGPAQVEYHTPDGHTSIWVGDRIYRGYWFVVPGLFGGRLCYHYGSSASNCDGDLWKGTPGRVFREGDPYGLDGSAAPRFSLRDVAGRVSFEALDQAFAARAGSGSGSAPEEMRNQGLPPPR